MHTIPFEIAEDIFDEINAYNEDKITELVEVMGDEQPFLMVYMISAGEDELNEGEHELLFFLGTYIWMAMKKQSSSLGAVTEEVFDLVEEKNSKMLEYLSEESEMGLESFVEALLKDYKQSELLRLIVEVVEEEDDEEEEDEESMIREEMKGIIFIYLKIVIDCLDSVAA